MSLDPEELLLQAANERCDAELRRLGVTNIYNPGRTGSGWKPQSMIRKGYLTDRKIQKYSKEGFYSEELRELRRKKRQEKFDTINGRLVYRISD